MLEFRFHRPEYQEEDKRDYYKYRAYKYLLDAANEFEHAYRLVSAICRACVVVSSVSHSNTSQRIMIW